MMTHLPLSYVIDVDGIVQEDNSKSWLTFKNVSFSGDKVGERGGEVVGPTINKRLYSKT